jgi:hypothetical protein
VKVLEIANCIVSSPALFNVPANAEFWTQCDDAREAAAAEAVSHWRYKPAACGQTPIRVETSIPINFTLSN